MVAAADHGALGQMVAETVVKRQSKIEFLIDAESCSQAGAFRDSLGVVFFLFLAPDAH